MCSIRTKGANAILQLIHLYVFREFYMDVAVVAGFAFWPY